MKATRIGERRSLHPSTQATADAQFASRTPLPETRSSDTVSYHRNGAPHQRPRLTGREAIDVLIVRGQQARDRAARPRTVPGNRRAAATPGLATGEPDVQTGPARPRSAADPATVPPMPLRLLPAPAPRPPVIPAVQKLYEIF